MLDMMFLLFFLLINYIARMILVCAG